MGLTVVAVLVGRFDAGLVFDTLGAAIEVEGPSTVLRIRRHCSIGSSVCASCDFASMIDCFADAGAVVFVVDVILTLVLLLGYVALIMTFESMHLCLSMLKITSLTLHLLVRVAGGREVQAFTCLIRTPDQYGRT